MANEDTTKRRDEGGVCNDTTHTNRREFLQRATSGAMGLAILGEAGVHSSRLFVGPKVPDEEFLIPTSVIVILTDSPRTAGIFVTPKPSKYKASMMSHGATQLLYSSWFEEAAAPVRNFGTLLQLPAFRTTAPQEIGAFARGTPGFALSKTPLNAQPVVQRQTAAGERLSAPGLDPLVLNKGRLLTRQIGTNTVYYHETAAPIQPGLVPIIDRPFAIPADVVEAPEMMVSRGQAFPGSGCGACAICVGCIICGDVNYAVATTGLLAMAALGRVVPLPR